MQSMRNDSATQQYEIPATRRSDGSWRKARKVKPGFVPQEEVPLYTPKGKRIAQANPYPPGWHPDAAAAAKPQATTQQRKPDAKKDVTADPKPVRVMTRRDPPADVTELTSAVESSLKIKDDVLEVSKRLKRLRRRIRELEMLEEKINCGEIAKPQKDQLEKISRRKDFEREIEELERQRGELKAQGFKHVDES